MPIRVAIFVEVTPFLLLLIDSGAWLVAPAVPEETKASLFGGGSKE